MENRSSVVFSGAWRAFEHAARVTALVECALSGRVACGEERPALDEFRTSMDEALERGELCA